MIYKILLLLFFVSSFVNSQNIQLLPVSKNYNDTSLTKFLNKLEDAIDKKDIVFIDSILDEEVHLSFGGFFGKYGFYKLWKPKENDTKFWEEIKSCIELGGILEDNTYRAPYTFVNWPDEFDAFEYLTVIDKNVEVKESDIDSSKTLKTISYEIVKYIYEENNSLYTKVETQDGLIGYIKNQKVRSPIDYRAIFEKKNNDWKMVVFIAGD